MEAPCRFNVFVGSETGFLKGVNTFKKEFVNLNAVSKAGSGVDRNEEITCMCWEDSSEELVYLGLRNQTVKTFSTSKEAIISTSEVKGGNGPLRGVGLYNRQLLTCTESGFVKLWSKRKKEEVVFEAGGDIWRMRQNNQCPEKFATGGKENDLQVWDLQTPDKPVFKAKNVRNDFLDLRVPVWVCDMQFIPDSERIITSTGYNQVRLYDPKARQRRPVISMEVDEYPLLSLSLTNQENQVVVGNSRGRVALVDLRKKALVHVFKGFAGSVRHVQCHPSLPLLASCGLDRHLRIHNLNDRKLVCKVYLKSRLNSLLLRSEFNFCLQEGTTNDGISTGVSQDAGDMVDQEELWQKLEVASDSDNEVNEQVPRQIGLKSKEHSSKRKQGKRRKHNHHHAKT